MRSVFTIFAAVSTLAAATAASAQGGNYPSPGYPNAGYQDRGYQNGRGGNIAVRLGQLQARIQAGIQSGEINRREAAPLREQLRQLRQLDRNYSVNGLDGRERADLQQRMRALREDLRMADGGGQGRYDAWNQWDREDGYGGNGRYDRTGGGYGDRHDNRYENRDGRDYDPRDDYQQPVQRGGLGGLVDSVLGTGGLRVGQRASDNLYGVPDAYRNQYRDGNGAYYRADGRQIYQIDARTNVVVRIFPLNR